MSAIITVENLSKKYTISHQRPGRYIALRDIISDKFRNLFSGTSHHSNEEEFWALKDLNFNIQQGDRVGIIGRNGAGKSTLLKILSRITEPTTGKIELRGRVASLLEVGTGFHPELTGRENIFLNGSVLGMSKGEIKRNFDEIVAFSGVEKFLDTPVKRYSSGMYVRLAFSVAAHLEPEILIVDEVLAVGDIEFQKKCIGKMEDVSKYGGRTVIFVSHNVGAIQSLCNRGILLQQGKLMLDSNIGDIVAAYLGLGSNFNDGLFVRKEYTEQKHLMVNAEIFNREMKRQSHFEYGDEINLVLKTNKILKEKFGIEVRIKNSKQEILAYSSSWINMDNDRDGFFLPGDQILIKFPFIPLIQDSYFIDFICRIPLISHVDNWWDEVNFTVTNCRPGKSIISLDASKQLGSVILDGVEMKKI